MLPNQDDFGIVRKMSNQLVLSEAGLDHVKRFEGFRAEVYDDLDPNKQITNAAQNIKGTLTIGYGHIGKHATVGNYLSQAEAGDLLALEMIRFENGLKELVKVPLSQGEYDALCGFSYNIGLGALRRSTLLRKLNALDYDGAAMEFGRWVYSKGQKLRGLIIRRQAEQALFAGTEGFGVLDLGALAAQGEDLLGIGSNVRPDAIEGAGVMKPKLKSKTLLTGGIGMVGSLVGYFAELDRTVQLVLLVMAFGYVALNRYLEWKAGEH